RIPRRALPTQLPGQQGHGTGQRRGHSRPRLGRKKVFHPHSAAGTLHPARMVPQFQRQLPHGEIALLSLSPNIVNLQASLSTNPAAQESPSQPVDIHQHALVGLFHLGHGGEEPDLPKSTAAFTGSRAQFFGGWCVLMYSSISFSSAGS